MQRFRAALAAFALLAAPGFAPAHDGVVHKTPKEAEAHAAKPGLPAGALPFPVDIRAEFTLTDPTGAEVTEADFRGKPMALFFGYANCESICSVALPLMGDAMAALGAEADPITPVMITVDPERDTPEYLAGAMPRYHPRMIGLTGSQEALADAREAFQVKVSQVATDATGAPIYSHGSFIYLIDGQGQVKSVLPPILGPERLADLMRVHLLGDQAGAS